MATIINTAKVSSPNAHNVSATANVDFNSSSTVLTIIKTASVGTNTVYVGDAFTYQVISF